MANPVLNSSALFNERKNPPTFGTATLTGQPVQPGYGTNNAPPPGAYPGGDPGAALGPDHLGQWTAVGAPDRLTYEDVIVKTGAMLGTVVLAGALAWTLLPGLALPAALVALVLGLVNSFKSKPSPALIIAYAIAEGLFLGGISAMLEGLYPGIVVQAVLATVVTFGVTLALYRSGKVRVRGKFAKVFMIALAGYAVFSLVNFGLQMFGVLDGWGVHSMTIAGIPLGIPLGIVAVFLAALCLVMDFDAVQTAVERGAPRSASWFAAFGLTVTLVWLYVEFLRLIAIFRE